MIRTGISLTFTRPWRSGIAERGGEAPSPAGGTDAAARVVMVAFGYMLHEAREALPTLQDQGIDATLVDLSSMPFAGDLIATLALENPGKVLTLEDYYGGGLGSAVAEVLVEYGGLFTVKQLFVRQLPKSGRTPDDVLRRLGPSAVMRRSSKPP